MRLPRRYSGRAICHDTSRWAPRAAYESAASAHIYVDLITHARFDMLRGLRLIRNKTRARRERNTSVQLRQLHIAPRS